jgi:hypothetical protein
MTLDWLRVRLTGGRCYAQGCGRLLLLHTPWRSRRCARAPLAVRLAEREDTRRAAG